jgi:hypothetical protein
MAIEAMAIEAMAIEAKAREGQQARRGEAAEEASTLAAAARLVLLWPCSPPKAVTKAQRSLGLSSEASEPQCSEPQPSGSG